MGTRSIDALTRRRPRWRSYLLLARVSNLPTVWSNALAGTVAVAAVPDWPLLAKVVAAVSVFYAGGMFLNDAFDAEFDAGSRPERPLPAADVSRSEVFALGIGLLAGGVLMLAGSALTLVLGLLLAAAIAFYDYRHKGDALAPLVMGVCRGLVYAIAGAAAGAISGVVLAGALVMTAYVSALTQVAKLVGRDASWLVPLLIAAISLVDAAFIAVASGAWPFVLAAALGFPLTLALQRVVPGD